MRIPAALQRLLHHFLAGRGVAKPSLPIRLLAPSTETLVRIDAGVFLPARILWLHWSRKEINWKDMGVAASIRRKHGGDRTRPLGDLDGRGVPQPLWCTAGVSARRLFLASFHSRHSFGCGECNSSKGN